ncbi:Bug family tripartite tricarboxylate transporter substrate binding protein [Neoroseomonas oryzicola]|uniref:Tripartite tricarboxylate transporter substrate binding protein n=1 Tax=Neoroseomonas oryzicola TaxID=535904 RepID=A0A9X9WJX2_9PROT|nr:tripartite tricarboxylate transporter substrate binding protein [Neoroseomonas oryzicola]MBR0660632.1 tripartite tricarboxylate transporter substrate binding protein [Neoroseomonas oryzicola]NKE20009.1 tripartite tricarboxylate transporter substrate binding protein [Neoroseomonas oryzicola]
MTANLPLGRRSALALAATLAAAPVRAQAWPTRPVRLVVPFPPGGPADAIGRILGERLAEIWGQPVVIDNRGGAGGNIGADIVAKAVPDGHTLLLAASSHVQGAALYRRLAFDPIQDFTPITQVAYYSLVVVVHPSVPAMNLRDLEALMRANPGQVTVTSAGVGTPTHLTAELFRIRAGLEFTHVPFQGAAPAHTALLAGQVQAMFHNPVLAVPAVQAGRLRALATTGAARAAALPEIPTLAESGYPGFDAGTWYAVLGPAGIPAPVVAKIDTDLRRVVALPVVKDRFAAQSLETRDLGPEALATLMRDELESWGALIQRLNIRQD